MAGRKVKFDADRRRRFLKLYAECGLVNRSARGVDIHPTTVFEHLKNNKDFEAEFNTVKRDFLDKLEKEAFRRAVEGVREPIYQRGEHVGDRLIFSDAILSLLLKRHIPEYRERFTADVNHSGAVLVVPGTMEDSHEWERQQGNGRDSAEPETK